ncbi:hypothetical protein ACWIUD_01535 [Helicobacter sp. 23-1044]
MGQDSANQTKTQNLNAKFAKFAESASKFVIARRFNESPKQSISFKNMDCHEVALTRDFSQ